MANAKFSDTQEPRPIDLGVSKGEFSRALQDIYEGFYGLRASSIPEDIIGFASRHDGTNGWVILGKEVGNIGTVRYRPSSDGKQFDWSTSLIGQNASGRAETLYDAGADVMTAALNILRSGLHAGQSPADRLSERLKIDGAKSMGVVRNTEETMRFLLSEGFEEIDLTELKPMDGWIKGILGCKEESDGSKTAVLAGQVGDLCEVELVFDKNGILNTKITCIHGPNLSSNEEQMHSYLLSLERKADARKSGFPGRMTWPDGDKVSRIMDLLEKNTREIYGRPLTRSLYGDWSAFRDKVKGSTIKFSIMDDPRFSESLNPRAIREEQVGRMVSEDRNGTDDSEVDGRLKDYTSVIRVRRKTGCWWALKTTGKNSYEHVANIVKAAGNDRWNVKWKGGATHKQVFNGLDEACGYIETFLNQSTEAHI